MTDKVIKDNPLNALVQTRQSLQKDRIRFSNRLSAIERGVDIVDPSTINILNHWAEKFVELEKEADDNISDVAKDYPIIERLTKIKGVGNLLAARLIASIDIEKDDTVSSLWRYAGLATIDGVAERPKKGEKIHYNKNLKTVVYLIGLSFLRSKSPYSAIYYETKEYYQANRPDWSKLHIHLASIRKMCKIFISHLWVEWRTLEGLPTSLPYILGVGKHSHYIEPRDFGWED